MNFKIDLHDIYDDGNKPIKITNTFIFIYFEIGYHKLYFCAFFDILYISTILSIVISKLLF